VIEKTPYRFAPFKIRTLRDQRFLITWVLVGFVVSAVLTVLIAVRTYVSPLMPHPNPGGYVAGTEEPYIPQPAEIPPWEVFGADKLTFILLGYDEVDEFAHRSDTLMVGAVDFYARKVRILSIPRDTLVYIPRYSFQKVNAAYSFGGADLVRRTVEGFTGVPVDYTVAVNYRGFVEMVDALGGVDITVEHAMNYDDRRGNVHIHIDPGEHHMDGEMALNYARFRHDATGDLGRIQRQQGLMSALFDQAIRPRNWIRLESAARTFLDNIEISVNDESPRNPPEVSIEHVLSLLGFLTQLRSEDIEFYEVPTTDLMYEGLSSLRPIYSRTGEILDQVFRDDDPIGWRTDYIDFIVPPGVHEDENIEGDTVEQVDE
jgi:LCP family protein required for cell wall assembly